MGKVESKLSESYYPSDTYSRALTETNYRRYSGSTNLSIFSCSWNIVKSSNRKKIKNTNLSSYLNSKQILLDTEKLLINFLPRQISKYQNLCLISTTFQHTLKESCYEIEDEEKDCLKDEHHIDIFIRGFLKFINIFSAYIESKLKKVMEIVRVFKRNKDFQSVLLNDRIRTKSILSKMNEEENIDQEDLQSSGRKNSNVNTNKVYENAKISPKPNEINDKSLKKNNIKSSNNLTNGKNIKKKNHTYGNIIVKTRPGSKNKNILIEDNLKKNPLLQNYIKKTVETKTINTNSRVSPEKRKNYSTHRVLHTEENQNVAGSFDFRQDYIKLSRQMDDMDIRDTGHSTKREEEPLFFQPKLNIINNGFNKNNRLVKSVAKIEKNSVADNSINDSIGINTFSRAKKVKSSLGGKEACSLSINKNKINSNQSMHQAVQYTSRINLNNNVPDYSNMNVTIKKNESLNLPSNVFNTNFNSTLQKKKTTQHSVKNNKINTNSSKSTIDFDDNKFSARKSDNLLSTTISNATKIKNLIIKSNKDNQPLTLNYDTKKTLKQTITSKTLGINQKDLEKKHRKSQTSTVHQLNVKINISQLNQHQTNNNTINNIYDSHKKNIKIEKEIIPEEKENYSSPDSTNGRLITLPNKKLLEHKNESSNSDSDTNIDLINNNRHNTPAFNHLHKRSNSSAEMTSGEITKNKSTIEKDLTPDEKFSFRGSVQNSPDYNEDDEDMDYNYNQVMNYIAPRIGSVDSHKKHKNIENNKVYKSIETGSSAKNSGISNKVDFKYKEIDVDFLLGQKNVSKVSQMPVNEASLKKERRTDFSTKAKK